MRRRVQSFEELDVYTLAYTLQQDIFEHSKRWPREERYALTDQIRRSSRSIGANLAEAWAKRRYSAHFVSKLSDADAEQLETRHWLNTARDCGYVPDQLFDEWLGLLKSVGSKLGKMIANPDAWTD